MKKPNLGLKETAIPASRFARLARLGGMASSIAGRAAVDALRHGVAGERPRMGDLLLTPANAVAVAQRLAEMRGAAMKVGQLLSMDAGDMLPPDLSDIFSRLRAHADPMPPRQLKSVLIANWGPDFLTRFRRFDVTPIAAASIGQVHRAWTRDGRELAIKVQYPGVRKSIDSDVANLAMLARASGLLPRTLDLAPLLEEAKRQLHEEADYELEARYLVRFASLIGDNAALRAPAFQPDLSTRDILSMNFIDSAPIESLDGASQGERDRVMTELFALMLRELFEFHLMQTDANFANYRYDRKSGRIVLLDFGATRVLSPELARRFRELLHAGLEGAREGVQRAACEIGYFSAQTAPRHQEQVLDMIEAVFAPIRREPVFDFGSATIVERLRKAGMALAAERDFDHVPPIDVLFVQRKLAGLFLLGARLRAKVDIRRLLDPYL